MFLNFFNIKHQDSNFVPKLNGQTKKAKVMLLNVRTEVFVAFDRFFEGLALKDK